MKLAKDLDAEDRDTYIEGLYEGRDPSVVARELGTTGTQFRKLCSPNSIHFDKVFADRVAAAKASEARGAARLDVLDGMIWQAAESGEKWAIEKLLLVYHPDFEKLRHTNLRVSGGMQVEHVARMLLPHMSKDEVIQRLEERGLSRQEIEERVEALRGGDNGFPQLPAPKAA